MNCCDEYGDCNQGRDCPIRVARIGRKDYTREPLPPTVWRRHLKVLAYWALLGLLGWLCFGLVFVALVIN